MLESFDNLTGNWYQVYRDLGYPEEDIGTNKKCPVCGGTDRASISRQIGTCFCRHCNKAHSSVTAISSATGKHFNEVFKELKQLNGTGNFAPKGAPKRDMTKVKRALEEAVIYKGTLAEKYLLSRGCNLPEANVFYHDKAWFVGSDNSPAIYRAMFSLIKNKHDETIGIHKTALNKRGKKVKIEGFNAKQITKASDIKGGFIPLIERRDSTKVVLGEGIESVMRYVKLKLLTNVNVFACISSAFLELVDLPDTITTIIIAGDADRSYAGQFSAFKLAKKLTSEGKHVIVDLPPIVGMDWNDVRN